MLIRAKTSATINVRDANGKLQLTYVKGPEFDDNEKEVDQGQVVAVPEDFDFHPDVFEIVKELAPARGGAPAVYEVIPFEKWPQVQQKRVKPSKETTNKAG